MVDMIYRTTRWRDLIKDSITNPPGCIYRAVYKRSSKKNPIKCGCFIFNEDLTEIVLVQNNYSFNKGEDKWGLPKGHREGNETYATCAKREVREETGLFLKVKDNMPKIKINNTFYFIIVTNKKNLYPIDTKEVRKACWVKLEYIPDINVNRETQIFYKRKLQEVLRIIDFVKITP